MTNSINEQQVQVLHFVCTDRWFAIHSELSGHLSEKVQQPLCGLLSSSSRAAMPAQAWDDCILDEDSEASKYRFQFCRVCWAVVGWRACLCCRLTLEQALVHCVGVSRLK